MAGSTEYSPMPTSTTDPMFDEYEVSSITGSAEYSPNAYFHHRSLFDEYDVSSITGSTEYSPMPTSTTDPCLMSMR